MRHGTGCVQYLLFTSSAVTVVAETRRFNFSYRVLPDRRALIAGGAVPAAGPSSSADLYDPATRQWSSGGERQHVHDSSRRGQQPRWGRRPAAVDRPVACAAMRRVDAGLLDELTGLVGPGQVSTETGELAAHARDCWPRLIMRERAGETLPRPAAVVWPTSTHQVAAVYAWATATEVAVGHFPSSITLSSVGGFAAARSAGQLSTKYGTFPAMVAGVEAVLPDGTVVRRRAQPASAAGPDLVGLMLGSEGTLGLITELTLRVHPKPQAMAVAGYALSAPAPELLTGATPGATTVIYAGCRSVDGVALARILTAMGMPYDVVAAPTCCGARSVDVGHAGRGLAESADLAAQLATARTVVVAGRHGLSHRCGPLARSRTGRIRPRRLVGRPPADGGNVNRSHHSGNHR